ncbi:hypothetical protein L6452_36306 [Arctium lappa]|uniref:Uncharacterized protein n=1 Tax=Arctium lappa TaxID=4217 RepID=A0ACB8Y843_ARCLA|nr:hypothetical protein L6452_36306 [Arctium lappa]
MFLGLYLNCGDSLKKFTENAVKKGLVKESVVDRAVTNNFATLMRLGLFDGIVLLKNSLGSLPLLPTYIKSVAVIGPNANATKAMIGNYAGIPCKYTTPLEALSDSVQTVYEPGCSNVLCNSSAKFDKAKNVAAAADAVVLVMGTDLTVEVEALDRTEIDLPGQQNLLVSEVAYATRGPVILVIMSGGGMDVNFTDTLEHQAGSVNLRFKPHQAYSLLLLGLSDITALLGWI